MTTMKRLASLSGAERDRVLANARRRATGAAAPTGPALVAGACPDGRGPASFVQEQLWFVSQLAGDVPAYNISFAFDIHGPCEPDRLRAAVASVLGRHDVLRTRFVLDGGRLAQEVTDQVTDVPVVEVADGPAADRRVSELSRTHFDLAAGPPLRLELLRVAPDHHVLAWVAHHCLADGWSFGVVLKDLAAAYRGASLAPARLQFLDVAHWQRMSTRDGLVAEWVTRLGAPPRPLPTDRPRPAAQTFRGGMLPIDLGPDAARAVADTAGRAGVTVFAVLLAAYARTLATRTGDDACVIGSPLAGRERPELNDVVGPLANTLPLRVELTGDVLQSANDALMEAVAGQDVPFSALVKAVAGGGRDASRNPLFTVLFNLGNLPPGADRADLGDGTTLSVRGFPNGTVRLDLELTMEHSADALTGRLEYNADLFDEATAAALLDDLRRELSG
jgi:hypothetical protein